jgi:mono/diheme cytochrome c family protein
MSTPTSSLGRSLAALCGLLIFMLALTGRAYAQQGDPYHPPPRDTVSTDVYNGWKVFQLNCARCHGEDATGTSFAPNLLLSVSPEGAVNTQELFLTTVCAGRKDKGMPAWCELGLELPKILQMYAYVKLRSDGKMGIGRPAVRSTGN